MIDLRFAPALTLAGSLLVVTGCSRNNADRPLAPAEERLLKLGNAYTNATYQKQRPPRDFNDIKQFLEGENLEDFLRSPNDGAPFVVHWGVDFTAIVPHGEDPFTIAAYEKNGVDGKRYVLRFPRSVVLMTEKELRDAVFPPGFRKP
jgi:hypothetical protein